jgi:hypothetical protein
MSFFSRLFNKKDIPRLEKLKNELETIAKKSNSEFLMLVGLSGKIKGLPVIKIHGKGQSFSEKQLRRFAARGAEFLLRYRPLELMPEEIGDPVRVLKFYYNSGLSFYVFPVPGIESFMLMALNATAIKILNNLDKITGILEKISPE